MWACERMGESGGPGGWRQYPAEKEITFPPMTCLESDGEPRVERTVNGELVIFPLKVPSPTPPAPHPLHPQV
jgi:hypothetical protein